MYIQVFSYMSSGCQTACSVDKTTPQKMDGTLKSRTHRKGVSFPTNTTTCRWFAHQKNNNSSQRTVEAKLTCRGCNREFLVPTKTTAYRCCACQRVNNSISGYKQSREDVTGSCPATGSSSSLSIRSNKRAVLCGVTYGKRKFRLKGPNNDVINMKDLLVNYFKFPMECIRVLTEEEQDPDLIPTKRNIVESLNWLVKDCQSGDSLVFYFSGHGLQQPEFHREDEIDGLDEALCPADFMTEGMITDNKLNSTIVWPLKKGVTLHAILDACHSGTTLDLMHVCKRKNGTWKWEDNKPPSKEPNRKHTSGGLAICLSACEDSQMAADTTAFGGKRMNGVMTYLFTKTIKEHAGITYGGLLEKMQDEIEKVYQSKCYRILKRICHRKLEQDPMLSSSEEFDVATRIFTM